MTNEKNRVGISRSNPSNAASEHVRDQAALINWANWRCRCWGGWGREAGLLGEREAVVCPISLTRKKGSQGNVVAATFGSKVWWWPLCKGGVTKMIFN